MSTTATFVLGDVVGSTRAWAERPEAMPAALAHLDEVVNAGVAAHHGERPMEQGEGDSFVASFARATDAVAFGLDVQRALVGGDLAVRMAIHTGEAQRRPDRRWMGPALNRCARIRALAAGGQVLVSGAAAALVVDDLPEDVWLRDLGRHRLRDLARPEDIRQLCHPELPAEFPPLASLDRVPNNLPAQLSSFVGRHDELATVAALLHDAHLVTLTGAGGAGKTRLALQAAAEAMDDTPDGVWLVDLAPLVEPERVPTAVAEALRVSGQPFVELTTLITNRIGGSETLVLLDNCEHLLDASAALVESLLRACPSLRILATSREPLGVEGEIVYRVPSLERDQATRLFAERASAVRSGFVVDERTAPAVESICARLDGLPLAIELAAARVRAMSPADIERQLDDRFRLLSAGRRGALPRQRTLEASVAWSHELLSDQEQAALRRLSVFAGGFTLELAERVVAGDGIDAWNVVNLLTQLVDRSLVQLTADGDGTRYGLLETVRVFAAARLDEAGEVPATRDRHLAGLVDFAAGLEPELRVAATHEQARVRIDAELDNIRAALEWAIANNDGDTATRLVANTDFLMGRDYNRFRELHQWYLSWRSLPGGDPADRARIELSNTVRTAFIWGDQRAAQEGFARLEAIAAAADDPALVPLVRFVSGALAFLRLDDTAVDTMRGAVDEILRTGDWRRLSAWGAAYAAALALSGQLSLATDFSERLLGDVPEDATGWLAAPAGYAVMYSVLQGRAESVSRYAGIAIRSVAGSYNTNEALAFAGNAFVSSAVGDHESARATIDAVVERMQADGTLINLAWSGLVRAWLCWRAGEPWDAAAANEAHRIFGRHYGGAWLMALRARHLVEEDAVADAVGTARDAVAAAAATRYAAVSRPVAQLALAEALLVVGEPADAANAAHEALRLALEQDQQWAIAEAFDDLARIAAAFGERLDSARLVGASDRVREEINWVRGVPDGAAISALDIDEAARAEGMQMSRDEAIAFAARGRGKRRRSTFGWSALTPTELDVVRLVAEGRRNNDIAEKLLMSPATVKTHLTHVFAKLGVSNRAELTAQAVERSLTTN